MDYKKKKWSNLESEFIFMKKIVVIGAGYVGLVSSAGLSEFGHCVTCVDIDKDKINQLNDGKIPIYEPGLSSLIKENCKKKRLYFSVDIENAIKKSDIIFIAVGTPSKKNGEVDLSYVESVSKVISKNINNYKVICTKSCLLYTSPSPRDVEESRMPSSA